MSESPYPSDKQDKFMLRLPDGMRDRIKAAAEANNRSMNAEIVATLEDKYPEPVDREAIMKVMRQMLDWLLENPNPDYWQGDVSRDATRHGLNPEHFTLEAEGDYASVSYHDPATGVSMLTFAEINPIEES